MRVWPIYKKEVRLYFTSPVAWVILAVFLTIAGLFFYAIFGNFTQISVQAAQNPMAGDRFNVTDAVLRPLFGNLSIILLFLLPLVSMRLIAEERRSGTIELLLTYPVRDGAILIGKYLAALTLYATMIAATLTYPAIMVGVARVSLDWGPLLSGYIGLLLMGAMFLAVGVFASSLTENQIIAGVVAICILLVFWIIGWTAQFTTGPLAAVLTHLSILEHNDTFAKGVLDTKPVIYYANFTGLALFLALRMLESRRWKG
jgi:ABC-2 type transport system permease protein